MLIFFYGPDSFSSRQKLSEIKEKFLKGGSASSGLSVFDYEESAQTDQILNVLGTPNLLAPKRLVIVKKIIASGPPEEQKKMLAYLKKNAKKIAGDKDLVAVFWEEDAPKKNNTLFKFLESRESETSKQLFPEVSGAKLSQWVLKRIKEFDVKANLTNSALEKLVAYSGGDMQTLNSEIQKLINFADGKNIKDDDIERLVNANITIKIFDTIDALGANKKKEAAKLFHEHLKRGEDPFYLFSMFVYQFRNLLKVADLKDWGGSSEYEIARVTGLHPFVVKKSLAQIRNFSLDRLKNIYQHLAELDTKIKTGKIDIRLALDKFIVEL